MAGKTLRKASLIVIAGLTGLLWSSCDTEKNVHAGNLVTVDGHVFLSRTQRSGVSNVTVILEKGKDSGTPAVIPDIIVHTDENGHWEARFTLSYPDGGDVMDITPQYVEESMRILMVAPEGKMWDLGSGFTFKIGQTYHIWDIFLEDFVQPSTSQ